MTVHVHRWRRTATHFPLANGTHWHTCRDCGAEGQGVDAICACRNTGARQSPTDTPNDSHRPVSGREKGRNAA